MSKINLQRGKLTVENRKSRERETNILEKTNILRSIGKQSGESVETYIAKCFAIQPYIEASKFNAKTAFEIRRSTTAVYHT